MDLKKLKEALKDITPEEIEKYFTKDIRPKGWISIEDSLPDCMAGDFVEKGYTNITVKNKEGEEFETHVCDNLIWYYLVKKQGVTHWLHE